MTKSSFLRISTPILILSAVLIAIHILLLFFALPVIYMNSKFWLNYLFLIPLTIGALYFIHKKYLAKPKSVGKSFFIYMGVKMVLTLVYLSPWLFDKDQFTRPMVYQFFALFFPLLFMETLTLIKLLNPKEVD